jgi:hypothetical protein
MRGCWIAIALALLLCGCGRYGPPVRAVGAAAVRHPPAADPNEPCEPETKP